jgi:hypothetical protein
VNSPRPTCCLIQLAITLINPSMSLIAISLSDPLPIHRRFTFLPLTVPRASRCHPNMRASL